MDIPRKRYLDTIDDLYFDKTKGIAVLPIVECEEDCSAFFTPPPVVDRS